MFLSSIVLTHFVTNATYLYFCGVANCGWVSTPNVTVSVVIFMLGGSSWSGEFVSALALAR